VTRISLASPLLSDSTPNSSALPLEGYRFGWLAVPSLLRKCALLTHSALHCSSQTPTAVWKTEISQGWKGGE